MNVVRTFALVAGLLLVAGCSGHHGAYRHGTGYGAERGVQEMMTAVEKAVPDPEKAKRVQAALTEIVEEVKQSYKQGREYHQKLYELNANYDATPEEFTKILDELNNGRMRTGVKILAIRFKMKEMLTAEEWKAMNDNLAAARAKYRHGHEGMEGQDGKKEGY